MSSFERWWDELAPIGRSDRSGGYFRLAYDRADLTTREWFTATAAALSLDVEVDRNGNQWAWWHRELPGKALVIGSHLDSVRDGGAYDGPLGVVSAFAAVEQLNASGWSPTRPIAIVSFADEEGARFGIACAGSRLLTGALQAARALALRDDDGVTLAEAVAAAGLDPAGFGTDHERIAGIGEYVELHVEQGRGLIDLGAPIAVASQIWPHGRYRLTFCGQANHAGTTRMTDRHDPMLGAARTALSINELGRRFDARATLGRMLITPNSTNGIPSEVRTWIDLRAQREETLADIVAELRVRATLDASEFGLSVDFDIESVSSAVTFDATLAGRVRRAISPTPEAVPMLGTGAGHDAGILATAGIPTAMLFVRNPTGISHSPDEYAELADALTGVSALASVVRDLAG